MYYSDFCEANVNFLFFIFVVVWQFKTEAHLCMYTYYAAMVHNVSYKKDRREYYTALQKNFLCSLKTNIVHSSIFSFKLIKRSRYGFLRINTFELCYSSIELNLRS